jgi:hypothetical protein
MADNEEGSSYLYTAFFSLFIALLVRLFRPSLIPFDFFEFWRMDGLWLEVIQISWPLFLWCCGVGTARAIFTRNDRNLNRNAEEIIISGAIISTWAGIVEEICFRWLIFFFVIAVLNMFNWMTFGLVHWIYGNIVGRIADFFTLGLLHPILFGKYSWAVGAAVLSTNGQFRDGHKYLGLFGYVNSWFGGMYLFYIMFNYGLPAAILIHFLYDFILFTIAYMDAVVERAQGRI